jgi:hypothetical protein
MRHPSLACCLHLSLGMMNALRYIVPALLMSTVSGCTTPAHTDSPEPVVTTGAPEESAGPDASTVSVDAGTASDMATTTPPPVTTKPPAGTSWVYYQGKYDWSGDWNSGLTANYTAKPSGFSCLTGADCLELTPTGEWGMWIPFPETSNNPNDTLHSPGIGMNITGFSYLTIAIYPTKAGFAPTFGFDYSTPGQVDLPAGDCVAVAGTAEGTSCTAGAYGPSPMVVGKWNVYNIPLSAFNLGSVLAKTNGWIYKFWSQEHGDNDQQTYYVDQVGFTTAPL